MSVEGSEIERPWTTGEEVQADELLQGSHSYSDDVRKVAALYREIKRLRAALALMTEQNG